MQILKRLSLTARIISLMCLVAFGFVCLFVWFLVAQRAALYAEKRQALRQVVELAHGIVEAQVRTDSGPGATATSIADAKRRAMEAIGALRYNGNDYLWINDLEPRMVMHPTAANLNGQNLADYADPNGKHLFVEAVEVCRRDGEGEVAYSWPKPGDTRPTPKLSYVKLVPEWGWVIGSGVYVDDIERAVWATSIKLAGALVVTLALTLSLGFLVARRTTRPVMHTMAQMREGAEHVSCASSEIAAAAQRLSQGATEQAASLEESSASLEEISSMTRSTAESAGHAASTVAEAEQLAGAAQTALQGMVQSMTAIEESSGRVAKIIKTIDEIAFQTNILALNAAVEAARAGSAGMGFAVVADEVRALAQRSADAAKNTSGIIAESIAAAQDAFKRVDDVKRSISAVNQTSMRVRLLVDGIADASRQQATGVEQVTRAVAEMERVTLTTAATAQQSAAASEELNAQALNTFDMVHALASAIGGGGGAAPSRPQTASPAAGSQTGRRTAQTPPAARTARPASQDELPAASSF